MDSLTQIVLGAACGEIALGKKIGNKALFFGAIGGTIPDLDVIVGSLLFPNQIDAMLFHRGFMHSISFSVIMSLLLGYVFFKFYPTRNQLDPTTQKNWTYLWFLSIFTHPILDCFTPYGTQLFAPFSNYRVAFNTIAVLDPAYTLPFLICVLILMFYNKHSKQRAVWMKRALVISSVYMLFTVCNKLYVDSIFKKSLIENHIEMQRFTTQPYILNNILWYGVAETETSYFVSNYSLFDQHDRFLNFIELPKQRNKNLKNNKELDDLSWFSNDYYNVYKITENDYRYNDLRYPLLKNNKSDNSVFSLLLYQDNQRLNMKPFEPQIDDYKRTFLDLWNRIKGI